MPTLLNVSLAELLAAVAILAPAVLMAVLGLSSLLGRKLTERVIGTVIQATVGTGLIASVGVLVLMLATGTRHVAVTLGNWVEFADYHFTVKFVFDRLSVPFVILSFILCGTIGAFATRYMHRERGYNRFFTLFALFTLGMVLTSLAGTIETLFAGWELVGLSSALLVAFFQERPMPVRNGLRVWVVYRASDAALLLAAILMHNLRGAGDFDVLLSGGSWPEGHAADVPAAQALLIGGLLLFAAAGKSALVPFSGWLPRAMEGPTPSSAVFYGALSVHLGAYLLLRVSPLLEVSPLLAAAVVALGLLTAVFAYVAGGVQTDIKSALSFASLVQVGLIVAEIGLGAWFPVLWYVALVHLIGHACLRTLQFLRAPTILQDYRVLENAIGRRLNHPKGVWERAPTRFQLWLYRFGLERGYLDAFLNDYVVAPFVRLFRWCDGMERRWTDFLSGRASRESDAVKPAPDRVPAENPSWYGGAAPATERAAARIDELI